MSKLSNIQRTESLRVWIAINIKHKSREAIMFVDPSKRITMRDTEVEPTPIVHKINSKQNVIPNKRKRYV